MINLYCFLPFHGYQVSSRLERKGFTFQGDIRGKDWEIQAGKAYYAALTWFCKASIRLICRWLSWAWWKGRDMKETETKIWERLMYFTTGWKKSPSLASKTENISWHNAINMPDTELISLIYKEILWKTGKKAKWKLKE